MISITRKSDIQPRVYQEVIYSNEGKIDFIARFVLKKDDLKIKYFTPDERKFYSEKLGDTRGLQTRLNQMIENHLEALQATVATLNHFEKPLPLAIQDGSFIHARHNYIYKEFHVTMQDEKTLTVQVRVTQNVLHVRYIKYGSDPAHPVEISERLSSSNNPPKKLKAKFEKFKQEFNDIFTHQKPVGKSNKDMLEENILFDIRTRQLELKTLQKYKKAIERFKEVCQGLQIIKYPKYDTPRIIDKFEPFPKLVLSYFFLSPYVKHKIPNLAEVVEVYRNLIEKRSMATPIIKRDPEVTYYALYIEDRLVVHKCQRTFGVLFPEVFEDSLRPLSNEEIVETLGVRINDSMINACANRGLIPPGGEKVLRKHTGKTLIEALNETKGFGYANKIVKIVSKEVEGWSDSNQDRFMAIVQYLQATGFVMNPENKGRPFTDTELDSVSLVVYLYLTGQIDFEDLDLNPSNAMGVLDVVKLFDHAIIFINILSRTRYGFERSSYELKAKILQMVPTVKSHEVFTKTLVTDVFSRCMEQMDPSRVGRHAKEVANQYVEAKEGSKTRTGLGGARGNSGAGKSTVASKGALNVDNVKAGLKKEHSALNSQIHAEAANVFERLLQEIIGKTSMNFYLDARLIELKHLESSLLNPALTRGTTADIADFDVPLATSLMRILTRPPYGKDPCPPFEAILDGFIGIRRERASIINHLKDNPVCKRYELFYKQGPVRHLVASKEEGKFKVHDEARFQRCLEVPSSEEIAATVDKPLTESDLEQAVQNQDIFADQKELLQKYLGKTLREAVVLHAKGGQL